jgi:hypothetical protein
MRWTRAEERRTDLRELVDVCVVALAEAEFSVSITSIRAQALLSGLDAQPYLDMDASTNSAVRGLRTAAGRLAVRVPDEVPLREAFAAATSALVDYREQIRAGVDGPTTPVDFEAPRVTAQQAIRRFHHEAAIVVGPDDVPAVEVPAHTT